MLTTLLRVIKYGIQSYWRNGLVTVANILVLVIALLVFEGLVVFSVVTGVAAESLQDKIDISVYFKSSSTEDEIFSLRRSLESLPEVKSVTYVSREEALEIFTELNRDNPTISNALDELDENPLLASLNIKAHEPDQYGDIAAYLEAEDLAPIIDRVTYTQSRLAIERLDRLVNTARNIGLGLTVFLALTAALVTFNTIQLAIYSNREEIGIMRLVGAPNIFINGPYIVQAVIFGVIAAIVSIVITAPIVSFTAPHITSFIPEMQLGTYFYANILRLFAYQLLFGVLLGTISASIAVRRYLKT